MSMFMSNNNFVYRIYIHTYIHILISFIDLTRKVNQNRSCSGLAGAAAKA